MATVVRDLGWHSRFHVDFSPQWPLVISARAPIRAVHPIARAPLWHLTANQPESFQRVGIQPGGQL
jgi:hypothetical protein